VPESDRDPSDPRTDGASNAEHSRRAGVTRVVYLAIGFFFVGLGALGAVLPVLPTTPLLLISLWAFSKSSLRFERWLLEHRRFGPRLVAWRKYRVIPWPAKLAAWGSMIASLTIMLIFRRPIWQIGLAAGLMAIGASYVASKPSRPPPS
jgi:uncharacterized membrane protein YbaN (DUF454 family)